MTTMIQIARRSGGKAEIAAKATMGQWAVHKPYVPPLRDNGLPWTKAKKAARSRR